MYATIQMNWDQSANATYYRAVVSKNDTATDINVGNATSTTFSAEEGLFVSVVVYAGNSVGESGPTQIDFTVPQYEGGGGGEPPTAVTNLNWLVSKSLITNLILQPLAGSIKRH